MRLTVFLLLVVALQVSAKSKAQKITLKKTNITLKAALKSIEAQSGYAFLWSDQQVMKAHAVSVDIKGGSLAGALDQILKDQPFTYRIEDKFVYIVPGAKKEAGREVIYQKRIISGTVTDSAGISIAGASITVKGTKSGTLTDGDGNFIVSANTGDILVVVHLGYASKEVTIGADAQLKI